MKIWLPSSKTSLALLVGCIFGCAIGFVLSHFFYVAPFKHDLDSRMKTIQDREKAIAINREYVQTSKEAAEGAFQKYISLINHHNTKFAEIQQTLHEIEVEMISDNWLYIAAASLIVLITLAVIIYVNSQAEGMCKTTIDNVAQMAPKSILKTCIITSLSQRDEVRLNEPNGNIPPQLEGPKM